MPWLGRISTYVNSVVTSRESPLLEDLIDLQLPNLRISVTSRLEVDIKTVLFPFCIVARIAWTNTGCQELDRLSR